MNAADVPYHLRTRKAIDRAIFIALLQRTCATGTDRPVYVSMGGNFLEDHAEIHTAIGLTDLVSFDTEEWVVRRQEFNRPISCIKCLNLSSAELIGNIEGFFSQHIGDKACIFWLDYTNPNERGRYLQEVRTLCSMLRHGDVLKVTLNASLQNFGKPPPGTSTQEHYLRKLVEQLDPYFPVEVQARDMLPAHTPGVLGAALNLACQEGLEGQGLSFLPLAAFHYADGQRMATFTGAVVNPARAAHYRASFDDWEFLPRTPRDVKAIDAPLLSQREKMEIDRLLYESEIEALCSNLGLSLTETPAKTVQAVERYKDFYRFYPRFARVSSV
jgi:hypothetical protein